MTHMLGETQSRHLLDAHERQRRSEPTTRDRQQARSAERHITLLANELVALARQKNAQVVVEDLTDEKRISHRIQQTTLNRRQVAALQRAIDARLEQLELPVARILSTAYIAWACRQCCARQQTLATKQSPRTSRASSCRGTIPTIAGTHPTQSRRLKALQNSNWLLPLA
jgi:hypothetical protein